MKKTVNIIGIPMDLGQKHRGVDMAPVAIRYAGLAKKLRKLGYNTKDSGNINVPGHYTLSDTSLNERLIPIQQACEKARMDTISDNVIRRTRLAKTMLDILASDAIETSKANLGTANIESLDEVLKCPQMLIGVSVSANAALEQLEAFLMQNMYLHSALSETAEKVQDWLSELFEYLCAHPDKMPHYYQQMIDAEGLQRTVCDYISGMTDRYCLKKIEQFEIIR